MIHHRSKLRLSNKGVVLLKNVIVAWAQKEENINGSTVGGEGHLGVVLGDGVIELVFHLLGLVLDLE